MLRRRWTFTTSHCSAPTGHNENSQGSTDLDTFFTATSHPLDCLAGDGDANDGKLPASGVTGDERAGLSIGEGGATANGADNPSGDTNFERGCGAWGGGGDISAGDVEGAATSSDDGVESEGVGADPGGERSSVLACESSAAEAGVPDTHGSGGGNERLREQLALPMGDGGAAGRTHACICRSCASAEETGSSMARST